MYVKVFIIILCKSASRIETNFAEAIKTEHGEEVKKSDIRWVLTVPAIWSDPAKLFMREAAEKAGIEKDQLFLALEPEAASIYCKEQAIRKEDQDGGAILRRFDPGEQYMVLDLGGGTVDITVNEVCSDGKLKETYAASGGPWGGTTVNEAFRKSIEDTVGKDHFSECILKDQNGWIDFEKEFETEKRKFYPCDNVTHKLHLPNYFVQTPSLQLAEKFKAKHGNALKVKENYLVIHSSKMEQYFDTAIDKIKDHISNLLQRKELSKLSSIMLVGGFAESRVVQEKIKTYFKTKTVFVPPEASVSVLKGSVMFGHNPNIIAERISPWTYGVHTRKAFNKNIHDIKRKQTMAGKEYVNNAFDKYLGIGESVAVGRRSLGHIYNVINPKDHIVYWKVYRTEKMDPLYCDENGVYFLGSLEIELPRNEEEKKWRLELHMTCRGTELEASVSDADTQEQFKRLKFDFLRSEYGLYSNIVSE
ncbi:hypothetical protein CHS0354_017156 [Potamilus streckersoni]|uniref:Heat shock 70 kDa protein 12A n=1 Tax=Potamilus streckersoni TaxID=2493646 RepID=A0AAE0W6B8_9BIVA|nr:hypothetical protein CHS0354_017156 [Potamilus streckersoni]